MNAYRIECERWWYDIEFDAIRCYCIRRSCFIFIPLSSCVVMHTYTLSLRLFYSPRWSEMYGICLWSDIYGFYCSMLSCCCIHHIPCARFIDNIKLIANGIGYNVNKNQMYYSFTVADARFVASSFSLFIAHLFRRDIVLSSIIIMINDRFSRSLRSQNWDKLMGNEFVIFDLLFFSSIFYPSLSVLCAFRMI